MVRPEQGRQRETIPAAVAGWSPQPNYVPEGRSRPSLRRFLPQVGSRTGALLAKALPASVVPASRLRAAVPIWTNPTVSGSLGGLPLTDARMLALEPRGTKGNMLRRGETCATATIQVYLYPLSQDYSPPKPFLSWFTGPVLSGSSAGPISKK